jgi:magnesium-transporting ATPase (P-type)
MAKFKNDGTYKLILKTLYSNLYWIIPLIIMVIGSWMLSVKAWDYLHSPIVLDTHPYVAISLDFPICAEALLFPIALFNVALNSPLWFQLIYIPCFIWVLLLLVIKINDYRTAPF